MELDNWLVYLSITFIATITPGPAVLLCTSQAIAFGSRNTIPTILGNVTGLFIMASLSVLGLSTLIFYSTEVFMVIKLIGAAYLIYLGLKLWVSGFNSPNQVNQNSALIQVPSWHRRYLQGLFIALSNPKAIMFTGALFPQFIDHQQPIFWQFSLMTLTFMFLSFVCLWGYAVVSEQSRQRSQRFFKGPFFSRLFGSAFMLSGVFLANTSSK